MQLQSDGSRAFIHTSMQTPFLASTSFRLASSPGSGQLDSPIGSGHSRNAARGSDYGNNNNKVDIQRIMHGYDVRTTVSQRSANLK